MDNRVNFFVVEYGDGDVYVKGFASSVTAYEFFRTVSEYISWGDCVEIHVLDIHWHGKPVKYYGWEPEEHYIYVNRRGTVVWEGYFPEFDH